MGIYDREYYRDDESPPSGVARFWPESMVGRLVVVTSIVHVVTLFAPHLTDSLALGRETVAQPWLGFRWLTYAFVHDANSLNHILFNMMGLWFLGRDVEERYGKMEFLRIYLAAAFLGGLLWSLRVHFSGSGAKALIGASGAVVAVTLLFVFNFPQRQVTLWFIPMPAWLLGVIIVGVDLFNVQMAGPRATVAYDVHLTGAAFALFYWRLGINLGNLIPSAISDRLARVFSRRARRQRQLAADPARAEIRLHQPPEEADDPYRNQDEEADRVLAKLHTEGDGSLTPQERQVLERYSRRMRQKHR